MKKIISLILALTLLLGAMFTLASCKKDKDGDTKTLTVATSPDFPPFENLENGEVVGIEIDIIKAICKELGYELDLVQIDFDSVIPGVQEGKYDCGVSGITVNEDRKKNVLFSEVYYVAAQAIVVKEGSSIASKADLTGKKISVQEGTTAEDYCSSNGYDIMGFKANPDAKNALLTDKVQAWVVDNLTAKQMVEEGDGLKILTETMTEEPYAFAFNFEDEALVEAIDEVLLTLIENGTVKSIFEKYGEAYEAPTK